MCLEFLKSHRVIGVCIDFRKNLRCLFRIFLGHGRSLELVKVNDLVLVGVELLEDLRGIRALAFSGTSRAAGTLGCFLRERQRGGNGHRAECEHTGFHVFVVVGWVVCRGMISIRDAK